MSKPPSLEAHVVDRYFDNGALREALSLINNLLRELKRLDDKMILTEVHLLESKVNYALANMPKAKAALTSARTAANSIYCPPLLQAQLDMQSGVLLAEDKDYKTAFSYFFETLEGYSAQDEPNAVSALKYMLLCKIMLNLVCSSQWAIYWFRMTDTGSLQPEDVTSLVSGKLAQKYAGRDVDAMKAVAKAHENRSLAEFEKLTVKYKAGRLRW